MIAKTKALIVFQTSPADLGESLTSLDSFVQAASSTIRSTRGAIPVMFNPNEITDGRTAKYSHPSLSEEHGKTYQYTYRDKFTVTLFFDTTDETSLLARNVYLRIIPLQLLLDPTIFFPNSQQPPVCRFIWGSFIYTGHIVALKEKYTLFSQEGFPLRAEVTVTFESSKSRKEQKKSSSSKNSRNLWTVRAGDRLDTIAYRVYGDSARWPLIAEENDIANPLDFPQPPNGNDPGDYGRTIALPEL